MRTIVGHARVEEVVKSGSSDWCGHIRRTQAPSAPFTDTKTTIPPPKMVETASNNDKKREPDAGVEPATLRLQRDQSFLRERELLRVSRSTD
jgi:hypothetical protein